MVDAKPDYNIFVLESAARNIQSRVENGRSETDVSPEGRGFMTPKVEDALKNGVSEIDILNAIHRGTEAAKKK